ncbi:hypothetical protein [Amycolatopsis sp. NPDC004079]|uniref:Uncharacterized protein n=1 Tax=Amycolatopsis halotolerans TaxID=330083 RepID=A0ABV7Q817_9PSEU
MVTPIAYLMTNVGLQVSSIASARSWTSAIWNFFQRLRIGMAGVTWTL